MFRYDALMPLQFFHPAVSRWFTQHFNAPTTVQSQSWPAIKKRQPTLIAAPTGSGKTLAAFLSAIDDLVREGLEYGLSDATQVLYISPLKALSNDIQKNLQHPINGIRDALLEHGLADVEIRAQVRTGDTPQSERAKMRRKPPHILVTTPESLFILLTSESGRQLLSTVRSVIIDEIHALAGNKRGAHLALSLARLDALCNKPPTRIGLSATQKPIDEIARFLTGTGHRDTDNQLITPPCQIIDTGHIRQRDLALELTSSPLEAVMANETWEEIYDRLEALISEHRTTLIFVNTRRLAERAAHHLADRIGETLVTAHHGSLSREHRLHAEQRLKAGKLRALVATASLELGIDIGDIDLVCQLGTPGGIATLLQRVGRSGHAVGALPKGRLFPLSCDDLVECTALLTAVKQNELDQITISHQPLDVLCQQIVAEVASREWLELELYQHLRQAWPYRQLSLQTYTAVVKMLADGFTTRRGRRGAYLHRDIINGHIRPQRSARLVAITNGGAIPDLFDYDVIMQPEGYFVGTVNEDFAFESLPGDIFQLGNTSYRMRKIEQGRVFVEDAHGEPPNIPFWFGEAPGRSDELSFAVSRFRETMDKKIEQGREKTIQWLQQQHQLTLSAATQLTDYLSAAKAALTTLPTQSNIIFERFLDETGDMHLVIHSPYGSRLNRAWGLALRKRFCRKFNFELQAAALEDSIVLSLGATHSFPLEEVASYLKAETVREVLIQALLDAPMFPTHWRWNANIALAVPRNRNGKKVPAYFQRNDAEDLVAVVFPDQIACLENIAGNREIPDHPLIEQTIHDCLTDVMDIDGLQTLLTSIHNGNINILTRDLNGPSPLAAAILNARPYAFLDDTPAEERRTLAVQQRRLSDPQSAADLGRLNPADIARVKDEAWPDARSADELHDSLVLLGFMTQTEIEAHDNDSNNVNNDNSDKYSNTTIKTSWQALLTQLANESRVYSLTLADAKHTPDATTPKFWVAAERLHELEQVLPGAHHWPRLQKQQATILRNLRHNANNTTPTSNETLTRAQALIEILRSRLEGLGPVTETQLAATLAVPSAVPNGITAAEISAALLALENEGFVVRGQFLVNAGANTEVNTKEVQWCERRLLARIHRYTIKTRRSEIEPVNASDYMRFLFHWHSLDDKVESKEALLGIIEQLEGFAIPAFAWENDILPARMSFYIPDWLDALCTSGRINWLRTRYPKSSTHSNKNSKPTPISVTPITLMLRQHISAWHNAPTDHSEKLSPHALSLHNLLKHQGALFFGDLVNGSQLLKSQVEAALGELVSYGQITADSYVGLRALVTPSKRRPGFGSRRRLAASALSIEDAGRWSLIITPQPDFEPNTGNILHKEANTEHIARVLLKRYGVVFRKVLERETNLPSWRELLYVYRRLEARGEIRGGRFVTGFSGEQFASPDAVSTLRDIRKQNKTGDLISVSAVDPLNLTGVITPGDRVNAISKNRVLYRDGTPIAIYKSGDITFLDKLDEQSQWQARTLLIRKHSPDRYIQSSKPT